MKSSVVRLCVVTGSRAEYGLLAPIILSASQREEFDLSVIVTGAHLSPEFGYTANEIEKDGIEIDRKIEILLSSDSNIGVCKAVGLAVISFAEALDQINPDVLLVLGDRYEIFAATTAAMLIGIPIAHCHGGELTQGAYDDSLRHSITKMSELHFVANDVYRKRVIQLGEKPSRVHNVGGLGVDCITSVKILERDMLGKSLGFDLRDRNFLITYHPLTMDKDGGMKELDALLEALETVNDIGLVFTMPNGDNVSRRIAAKIERFCKKRNNARIYSSLGQQRYYSCLHHFDGVIGNSSSGIAEAPSFRTGTINIGDRQKGREFASSIISCRGDTLEISKAIEMLLSKDFQQQLEFCKNTYGESGASEKILKVLSEYKFERFKRKEFHDV